MCLYLCVYIYIYICTYWRIVRREDMTGVPLRFVYGLFCKAPVSPFFKHRLQFVQTSVQGYRTENTSDPDLNASKIASIYF